MEGCCWRDIGGTTRQVPPRRVDFPDRTLQATFLPGPQSERAALSSIAAHKRDDITTAPWLLRNLSTPPSPRFNIACDNRYMIRTLLLAVASFLALHAQDNPFSDDAGQAYGIVKVSLLRAAERMPAADYSFRTTPKVRTFAEMIDHVTRAPDVDVWRRGEG